MMIAPPTPVPSVRNTLACEPALTPATDSARPATVASLSTCTGLLMCLCISSTKGTSCQPRFVQKGMTPVLGSQMPGTPTPMPPMSAIVQPASAVTRSHSAAIYAMIAS